MTRFVSPKVNFSSGKSYYHKTIYSDLLSSLSLIKLKLEIWSLSKVNRKYASLTVCYSLVEFRLIFIVLFVLTKNSYH